MTDDRIRTIDRLVEEARSRPVSERPAFLGGIGATDPALRFLVEAALGDGARAANENGQRSQSQVQTESFDKDRRLGDSEPRNDRGDSTNAPQMAGPYELLHQIGSGGMGAVWVAVRRDKDFRQHVAVKLLRPDMSSDDLARRFRTERRILAAIDHPNIARLFDGGATDDGRPYFAMEYIDGQRIDDYCDNERLSVRQRLVLFQSVCNAVQFAHQNLVVHRDIKPGNILVTADGVPKLLDFGIAKLLSPLVTSSTLDPTRSGMRMMTPEYASPEQILGEPITTATDIYSLGVLLFKLLTGHWPYRLEAARAHEITRAICEEEPVKPSVAVTRERTAITDRQRGRPDPDTVSKARSTSTERLRRELSGDIDNIVLTALRKEPHKRYASAEQLSEDIRRHLVGLPVMARRDSTLYRASKFVRRHRLGVAMTAGFIAALVTFGLSMVAQRNRVAAERDRAESALERAEVVSGFLEDTITSVDPFEGGRKDTTVVEVLDAAVPKISSSFEDLPEARAELQSTIGNTYLRLGRLDDAELLLRSALDTWRTTSAGRDHPEMAVGTNDLANLLRRKGEYVEAESLYRESLEIRRRIYGEKSPQVATVLNNLGTVLDRQSDYEAAEEHYRRALAMRRETLGTRHENVAESQNALANVLRRKGNYDEAEELYRQALALRKDLYGDRHPDVAESLSNLGMLFYTISDYEAAEPLYRQSLKIRREVLGEEHPDVARGMTNLARLLRKTDRAEEAEILYLEALAVRRKVFGDRHPEIATNLNDLGTLYSSMGNFEAAEDLYRQSLALRRELLGNEHWYVAMSLNNLAVLLNRTGRRQESVPLYREALELMRNLRGDDHPDVATTMTNLAVVLARVGEFEEAEEMQLRALEIRLKTFGEDHPETLKSYRLLADLYASQGMSEKASEYGRLMEKPD